MYCMISSSSWADQSDLLVELVSVESLLLEAEGEGFDIRSVLSKRALFRDNSARLLVKVTSESTVELRSSGSSSCKSANLLLPLRKDITVLGVCC